MIRLTSGVLSSTRCLLVIFMRGNYALLSQYCRHVVAARRVAQLINLAAKEKEFDRKEFGALLQLQATESAAITRLLRSMRLTQQSVLRAETTKHPKGPRMKVSLGSGITSTNDRDELEPGDKGRQS
jgi:hypothetical protein